MDDFYTVCGFSLWGGLRAVSQCALLLVKTYMTPHVVIMSVYSGLYAPSPSETLLYSYLKCHYFYICYVTHPAKATVAITPPQRCTCPGLLTAAARRLQIETNICQGDQCVYLTNTSVCACTQGFKCFHNASNLLRRWNVALSPFS